MYYSILRYPGTHVDFLFIYVFVTMLQVVCFLSSFRSGFLNFKNFLSFYHQSWSTGGRRISRKYYHAVHKIHVIFFEFMCRSYWKQQKVTNHRSQHTNIKKTTDNNHPIPHIASNEISITHPSRNTTTPRTKLNNTITIYYNAQEKKEGIQGPTHRPKCGSAKVACTWIPSTIRRPLYIWYNIHCGTQKRCHVIHNSNTIGGSKK